MKNVKKRESNIELLRIIAMIMIVFHHFAVHGDFNFSNTALEINHFWYSFLYIGGKLGVNVFVLISGYFLVNDKKGVFNFKHIFKFLLQVLFYSVVIFLVFTIMNDNSFDFLKLKEAFFPLIFGKWWFATAYVVLYLLHPFINKLLINLNKKEYKILVGILIVLFSIIPTYINNFFPTNDLIWFVSLYCIAGYIRIYGLNEKINCKHYFLLSIILFLIIYLKSIFFLHMTKSDLQNSMMYIKDFSSQKQFLMLFLSVVLFMGFNKLNIKYSRCINFFASTTFGVYLIHDEPLVREFLWKVLFKSINYQNSLMLIPYTLLVCFVVYIGCVIIEIMRQKFIEGLILNNIEKYFKNRISFIKWNIKD